MLNGFEKYLYDKGKSANTVKSYMGHVDCFIKWYIGSHGMAPRRLDRIDMLDYISYLKSVKHVSPQTVNAKIHALVKFNLYLIEKGLQDRTVISSRDKIKVQKEHTGTGTVAEEAVEEFIRRVHKNETSRDYTLAVLFAYSGLKISEALGLRLQDVDIRERVLAVGGGSEGKQRKVPVDERVVKALDEYIKETGQTGDGSQYIFKSRQRDRLCRTRVNQIFNKHSDNITPEKLRRFYYGCVSDNGRFPGKTSRRRRNDVS